VSEASLGELAVPGSSGPVSPSTFRRYWVQQRTGMIGLFLLMFVILLVSIGPFFAPYNPNAIDPNYNDLLAAPSGAHWMGTDNFGRDVFSRWLYGGRLSLIIAFCSVGIALVAGGLGGMIAGYKNRTWADSLIMRAVDTVLALPPLVFLLAFAGATGGSVSIGPIHLSDVGILIVFIAIVFTPIFARIARASALAELQEDYISASRALGMRAPRIIFRNLLPNVLPSIVIQASFLLAAAISLEATVSFLGYGVRLPQATWGNLLNGSRDYMLQGDWWLVAFPVGIIIITVLAFNLIGDALRDVLDPRRRSRGGSV
jgi:peptide/nickel transport system permease protein